jgi:hypothetical protein
MRTNALSEALAYLDVLRDLVSERCAIRDQHLIMEAVLLPTLAHCARVPGSGGARPPGAASRNRGAAAREDARRARMRDAMHERTEIASRCDSAFRSFGTTVPEPADDERPSAYRNRLFNRLARRLSATGAKRASASAAAARMRFTDQFPFVSVGLGVAARAARSFRSAP